MIEIYLVILLIFIIIGALIAVETKDLLAAVISLGVLGLGISISFLFLQAPDLAIVQIPVEGILLIFLVRSTIGRSIETTKAHINWEGIIFNLIILIGLAVFGIFAFKEFEFGKPIISSVKEAPSNTYIQNGLKETGAANIVSAIILDYRGYDTLGEAIVLFTSIVGALVILRSKAYKDKGEKK